MRIRYLVFLSLSVLVPALIAANSQAQEFCFSLAENYYEQLYCELKAKGVSKGLPSLYVFKTNEPLTQALLLKRPAAKIGIEVTLPKKTPRRKAVPASTKPSKSSKPDKIKPEQNSSQVKAVQSGSKNIKSKKAAPVLKNIKSINGSHPLALCALRQGVIECKSGKFHLSGNKRNKNLLEGVLLSANKLAIESYQPKKHKDELLNKYLEDAYRLYIEKMFEIGLGAATLSYPKFVFLFNDMEANNVDFSGRFETMFKFLKKDKLTISVSGKVPGNISVSMENCMLVNANIIACESGRKNYLYVKKS